MPSRPFRFSVSMPVLTSPTSRWRDQIRRIEDLGFSAVAISDHLTGGWAMDPIVAMTVAAEATTTLRVLSLVCCNDFRHPVLLHKSMANLDVFSGGRVEIGLGAGWSAADYHAAGIPHGTPAARVSRLAEAVDVLRGLFGAACEPNRDHSSADAFSYQGRHYQVNGLVGLPRPVQRPHPPLLVGGGSRRVLELAGRAADIAGINPRLAAAVDPAAAAEEMGPGRVAEKVAWVRAGASAAQRNPDAVELQLSLLEIRLRHPGGERHWNSSLARDAPAEALAASPAVLHGDLDRCVDALVERRERFGISYLHLGSNLSAAAPIVGRLAGS